jgi:hypothetical protein
VGDEVVAGADPVDADGDLPPEADRGWLRAAARTSLWSVKVLVRLLPGRNSMVRYSRVFAQQAARAWKP